MGNPTPDRAALWNLPNALTLSRLALGVVLFVFIETHLWLGCLLVFALAALTDWLDGYFARRQNLVSAFGRMLDPLVDKVVVCGAFILLLSLPAAQTGLRPWMVVVIVSRELLITGLRGFMEQQGAEFGADLLGKCKMFLQCIVLFALFALLSREDADAPANFLWLVRDGLVYAMIVVTALSGLQYLYKAALVFK